MTDMFVMLLFIRPIHHLNTSFKPFVKDFETQRDVCHMGIPLQYLCRSLLNFQTGLRNATTNFPAAMLI